MNKTSLLFLALLVISCSKPIIETGAVLSVVSKGVTVNGKIPTVGMTLNVGDVVMTMVGAEAAIEFYNGSIVRLRENTSVTIKKLSANKDVVLEQERGQTWNRVTKLAGINTYAVETPNTVATVRGTGFKVTVDAERTWVGVADGSVAVQKVENDTVLAEVLVEENKQAEIFFEEPEAGIAAGAEILVETLETDEWFDENIVLDEQYVEETYASAGEEVPPEYVEEFAEHIIDETDQTLKESNDGIISAEETIGQAEELIAETSDETPEEAIIDPIADQTVETTVDEAPPAQVEEIALPDAIATNTDLEENVPADT